MATAADKRKADQLARARASLSAQSITPGTVVGGEAGLRYTVIDLDGAKRSIIGLRAELHAKGYDKVEPTPDVVGVNNPEVWAIDAEVYDTVHRAAREAAAARRMKQAGVKIMFK